MTAAQAEGTRERSSPPGTPLPASGRSASTLLAVHRGPQRLQGEANRVKCFGEGGTAWQGLHLGQHLAWGHTSGWEHHNRHASPQAEARAAPRAHGQQIRASTFTLKQPTSHNLICHFLRQKWSSFRRHPDNVNEMENTPSGSCRTEQKQEKDISRGRLSTFLWADETLLITLDILCSTSPQLTKFWLQRCCLYCHHSTEY